MSKNTKSDLINEPPKMNLSSIIEELHKVNMQLFKLKAFADEIVPAIKNGDFKRCEIIVSVMEPEKIFTNE